MSEGAFLLALESARPEVAYTRYFDGVHRVASLCTRLDIPLIAHVSSDSDCQLWPQWTNWRECSPLKVFRHRRNVKSLVSRPAVVGCATTDQSCMLRRIDPRIGARVRLLRHVWPDGPTAEKRDVVLWVGNMRPVKQPEVFINLARVLPDTGFAFEMIGRIGMGRYARLAASVPSVRLLGELAPADAAERIAEAALLVCTSKFESMPNTFVQAFSSGTPVVSLCVNPDNVLCQHGLGCVSGTESRLAEQVRQLLDDFQLRQLMGSRGRAYFREHHSWLASREQYWRAFDDAASLAF